MKPITRPGRALLAAVFVAGAAAALAAPASAAGIPAHPAFTTTAPAGTRNQHLFYAAWRDPQSGLTVTQDMWDCQRGCGPQTLWADSSSSWGVVSNQAKGNTTVLTYPNVRHYFTQDGGQPIPVREFGSLRADYRQSQPSSGDFESAFDIWLNGYKTEVMVWTDNQGQVPAGKPVATAAIEGQAWTLWRSPGNENGSPAGGTDSFVLHGNQAKGTVHVLALLDWLDQNRYIAATATVNDVEYGWEICSTNGRPENFTMLGYKLTATRS